MNHKLSQKQYDALFDKKTSVKEFKAISEQINDRFAYIIAKIDEIVGREREWCELLENIETLNECNDGSVNIIYDGGYNSLRNEDFDNYEYDFPATWLKDDFEQQLIQEVKEFESETNKKKTVRQSVEQGVRDTIASMKESIVSKLSAEELAYINFKPFKEVIVDYDKAQAKKEKEESRRAHLEHIAQFKDKPKNKLK